MLRAPECSIHGRRQQPGLLVCLLSSREGGEGTPRSPSQSHMTRTGPEPHPRRLPVCMHSLNKPAAYGHVHLCRNCKLYSPSWTIVSFWFEKPSSFLISPFLNLPLASLFPKGESSGIHRSRQGSSQAVLCPRRTHISPTPRPRPRPGLPGRREWPWYALYMGIAVISLVPPPECPPHCSVVLVSPSM